MVDNHSTDGSVLVFREKFGTDLNIIECQENFGYAGGLNPGIIQALKKGAEWILLLNNDVIVDTAFFREFDQVIEAQPDYSIFGPLIFYNDEPDRIWYLGDRLLPGLLFTRSISRNKRTISQFQQIVPVDFISGCAMLVKREVFMTIGYYSTQYFMYGEDVDFCWRAHLSEFKLASVPYIKMWHKISASSWQDRPLNRYWRIRNQIVFYRKYSTLLQVPFHFALSSVRTFIIIIMDLLHRQFHLISPSIKGWFQGWFYSMRLTFNDQGKFGLNN